ncbi:MAG: imidazoleglycerol-phosphate dehydratase, partial [Oscillospiraceae bacterium]
MRKSEITRMTKETSIKLSIDLDGGESSINTGIGFFDHMLTAFAVHSGFSMVLSCKGDLNVDCHHTIEDV